MIHVQLPKKPQIETKYPIRWKESTKYFKVKDKHLHIKGDKLFKCLNDSEYILTVCRKSGMNQRGLTHTLGIHLIKLVSFTTNYSWDKGYYLEEITQSDFEKVYHDIVNQMLTKSTFNL